MKLQGKIFGLLILLLIFGCRNNENASFEMADEKLRAANTEQQQEEEIDIERKLIN